MSIWWRHHEQIANHNTWDALRTQNTPHDEIMTWKRFLHYWPFEGNPPVTDGFPLQWLQDIVMQTFDVFYVVGLKKLLNQLWSCWWSGRRTPHWRIPIARAPIHIYWSVLTCNFTNHDDVIKWKHFPRYWPFVRWIHRSPVNSPHKGQWRGAFKFSLICAWINRQVNNREAGDLRRYRAHYDGIVMIFQYRRLMR